MESDKKAFLLFASKATYVFVMLVLAIMASSAILIRTVDKLANADYNFERSYRVAGTAKRQVTPDTANINMGVVIRDANPAEVQRRANDQYQNALDAIKAIGIEEKDIKTTDYYVNSVYDYEKNIITGYEINLQMQVTVNDVKPSDERIGKVISIATEKGFNNFNGVSFYIKDEQKIQDEMKAEAINDAVERAKNETSLSGLRIGRLLNQTFNDYNPMPFYGGDLREEMVSNTASYDDKAAVASIDFQPGQTEVIVNVTLEYEIVL